MDMYEWLDEIAAEHRITVSDMIRTSVQKFREAVEKTKKNAA